MVRNFCYNIMAAELFAAFLWKVLYNLFFNKRLIYNILFLPFFHYYKLFIVSYTGTSIYVSVFFVILKPLLSPITTKFHNCQLQ